MPEGVTPLSQAVYWLMPGLYLFILISFAGIAGFGYIVYRRLIPLVRGEPDIRFDHPWERLKRVLKYWLGQWKHPRYMGAGVLHILLFAGFMILVIRAFAVLGLGFSNGTPTGSSTTIVRWYGFATNYATTVVFLCVLVAIFRRLVLRPVRYEVPPQRGKSHRADAIFLLGLIGLLMLADSLFEGSQPAEALAPFSMPWPCNTLCSRALLPDFRSSTSIRICCTS